MPMSATDQTQLCICKEFIEKSQYEIVVVVQKLERVEHLIQNSLFYVMN